MVKTFHFLQKVYGRRSWVHPETKYIRKQKGHKL